VERSVLISMAPARGTGYVNQEARFDFSDVLRDVELRVTSSQWVTRGGRTAHRRWTVDLVADPTETGWNVHFGHGFDEFDAQLTAANTTDPPPPYDGPLVDLDATRQAYSGVIVAFLRLVDAMLDRSTAEAQNEWWLKPNVCATIDWAPPSGKISVDQGGTAEVQGRILPRAGELDGRSAWATRPAELAGNVARRLAAGSRPGSPMRFEVRAGAQAANPAVHIRWRVPSTVGTAEAEWTARGLVYPNAWVGHGTYEYTDEQTTSKKTAHLTAMLRLTRLRRDPTQYLASSGEITWEASGSEPNCTWTAEGARRVTKYDLFLQLNTARTPYRAEFSAQDTLDIKATVTCTIQGRTETHEEDMSLIHPFFALGRITEGVPVSSDLTQISGSKHGSESTPYSSFTWRLGFGFLDSK
jgi:hypothetical protein